MSYMHVKYIIIISNDVYLAYKFLRDFIPQNTRFDFSKKILYKSVFGKTDLIFPKNIGKFVTTAPPSKLGSEKLY